MASASRLPPPSRPTLPAAAASAAPAPATLKKQTSRPQVPKTIPAGPAMWDYIPVWLRRENTVQRQDFYTYAVRTVSEWANMGDNLVIALPALRARYGDVPLTNRLVYKEIWRKVQRYVLPAKREAFNALARPFHVHVFAFDNAKRGA